MESYKHSCPVCGQHVEYTAGYCGRQMQCPICGNTITFPAIPPSSGGKTVTVIPKKSAPKWAWNPLAIYVYLRDFPHWKTLMQIAIPFAIIGALLAGASFVKNTFSDEPVAAPTTVVEGQAGGWDKMNELARSNQKMQQYVQSITQARRALANAQATLSAQEKALGQARDGDERQAIQAYVQSAERAVAQAQNSLTYLRQHFQTDLEKYRQLGGTIDYASRIPN